MTAFKILDTRQHGTVTPGMEADKVSLHTGRGPAGPKLRSLHQGAGGRGPTRRALHRSAKRPSGRNGWHEGTTEGGEGQLGGSHAGVKQALSTLAREEK